ncbi:unnamed protein product [Urochloa humidicola]
MARKRRRGLSPVIEIDSDIPESDDDFEVHVHENSEDMSDGALMESDELSSSDDPVADKHLYRKVLYEYKNLSKLKKKLKRKLSHQYMKHDKPVKKPKETFSRFSVTCFSKVVSIVSATRSNVIEFQGFGSLLSFDKCYVPWKFAKWVAQQVDYKSGDIIIGGKVISLTAQSVHLVLGLPLGGRPFPRDYTAGKANILQRFNLQAIPPVMFFVDKLTNEIDTLSDEDVFISFLLVALSTFLCPNASRFPSLKHLGIFSDVNNARQFDWSGYILSWLLQHIRSFNGGKSSKLTDEGTLGGCLYYLAVIYLDFLDFRPRMIADDIPRIFVWKGSMIQHYSQMDSKSNASFGLRPKLDFSETYYANSIHLYDSNVPTVVLDDQFMDKLDLASRCKLPVDLKNSICKIVQSHTLNCGMSIQLDLTALSSLRYTVHVSVAKLLQHASSVDSRAKSLVLEILKVITEYPHDDGDTEPSVAPSHQTSSRYSPQNCQDNVGDGSSDSQEISDHNPSSPIASPRQKNVTHSKVANVEQNVSNSSDSPCTPSGSSKRPALTPNDYAPTFNMYIFL